MTKDTSIPCMINEHSRQSGIDHHEWFYGGWKALLENRLIIETWNGRDIVLGSQVFNRDPSKNTIKPWNKMLATSSSLPAYVQSLIITLSLCLIGPTMAAATCHLARTGNLLKAVARFGEFCSWCCLPLLPQLTCSILATWKRPHRDSLYRDFVIVLCNASETYP